MGWKYLKGIAQDKKTKSENEKQAELVESIAAEIRELIKAGKPVPEELRERLSNENRKLTDSTFSTRSF